MSSNKLFDICESIKFTLGLFSLRYTHRERETQQHTTHNKYTERVSLSLDFFYESGRSLNSFQCFTHCVQFKRMIWIKRQNEIHIGEYAFGRSPTFYYMTHTHLALYYALCIHTRNNSTESNRERESEWATIRERGDSILRLSFNTMNSPTLHTFNRF